MNRIAVAVAFVSGLILLPSVAEAQQVTMIREKDNAVDALFISYDSSGCIETDVIVNGGESMIKEVPGGSPQSVPFAFVTLVQSDICGGTFHRALFGQTDDVNLQVGGNLDLASLQATVPMLDEFGSIAFNASVDLTWTNPGDVLSARDNDVQKTAGFVVVTNFRGKIRQATASGSVSDGSTNYTPGASVDGDIQELTSGMLTVIQSSSAPASQPQQ